MVVGISGTFPLLQHSRRRLCWEESRGKIGPLRVGENKRNDPICIPAVFYSANQPKKGTRFTTVSTQPAESLVKERNYI